MRSGLVLPSVQPLPRGGHTPLSPTTIPTAIQKHQRPAGNLWISMTVNSSSCCHCEEFVLTNDAAIYRFLAVHLMWDKRLAC